MDRALPPRASADPLKMNPWLRAETTGSLCCLRACSAAGWISVLIFAVQAKNLSACIRLNPYSSAEVGKSNARGTPSTSEMALKVLVDPVFPVRSIWDSMLGVMPTKVDNCRPFKPRQSRTARTGFSPAAILSSSSLGSEEDSASLCFKPVRAALSNMRNCDSSKTTRRSLPFG